MATVRAEYSQMQIKCLFVKDVNMVTVQPQKAKADAPPSPPLLLCHHTPSAGQKGSYCIPPVLRIDSSVFSREKRTPPLTPHARVTELAEGAPSPPLLPPWSPPHLILALMKQH